MIQAPGAQATRVKPVRKPSTLSYNPALDGVRAFAVVGVMLDHTGIPAFAAGGRGVQAFFVLSGFLITSLLIAEWFDKRGIDLGRFYARRLLRLYPALLLVLIVMVAIVPQVTPVPTPTQFGILSILLYFSNWNYVLTGTNSDLGYLPQMWSLAVEEQFYLVWPAVVLVLMSLPKASRNLLIATVALGALAIADQVVLAQDSRDVSGYRLLGTDVQGAYLMMGCALAVAVARYPRTVRIWTRRLLAPALVAVVMAVGPWQFGPLPSALSGLDDLRAALQFSLFGLASTVVIGFLNFASPRSLAMRIMSFAPLVLIGRISYGMYLWHFPIFVIVEIRLGSQASSVLGVLLDFAITLVVAALSFVLVERPLLRLKDRLRTTARPVVPTGSISDAKVAATVTGG